MKPALVVQPAAPEPISAEREALAKAILRRTEAEAQGASATETLNAAKRAVTAAEAELRRFGDLDKRLASMRAMLIANGDASGPLPDHIQREREARRVAIDHLDELRGALALLEAQKATADSALIYATNSAHVAAWAVILDESAVLADELRAAHARMWSLRFHLQALDQTLMTTVHPDLRGLLTAQLVPLIGALNVAEPFIVASAPDNPIRLAAARWRDRHAALISDADAGVAAAPVWDQ